MPFSRCVAFQSLDLSGEAAASNPCRVSLHVDMWRLQARLMLDSNFGQLHRVAWSRASRTDKGVHSLGTVRWDVQ